MSILNTDQIKACRENPLAALLARKFDRLLNLVMAVIMVSMLLAGSSVAASIGNVLPMLDTGFYHAVSLICASATGMAGVCLMLELHWMKSHGISPICFLEPDPKAYGIFAEGGIIALPTTTKITDLPPPLQTQPLEDEDSLDRQLSKAIWVLRNEAAAHRHNRDGAGLRHKALDDYHGSFCILYSALADIIDGFRKTADEKKEYGHAGAFSGTRQIEMTNSMLNRASRISLEAARRMHGSPENRRARKNT